MAKLNRLIEIETFISEKNLLNLPASCEIEFVTNIDIPEEFLETVENYKLSYKNSLEEKQQRSPGKNKP